MAWGYDPWKLLALARGDVTWSSRVRTPNGERAQKMRRMDVCCTSCWLGDWPWLIRIAQWCVFWMRPVSCTIPDTAPVRLAFPYMVESWTMFVVADRRAQ